jgi:agmatine/peptidylarginine deiminase
MKTRVILSLVLFLSAGSWLPDARLVAQVRHEVQGRMVGESRFLRLPVARPVSDQLIAGPGHDAGPLGPPYFPFWAEPRGEWTDRVPVLNEHHGVRIAGEFERQRYLVLACGWLDGNHATTIATICKRLSPHIQVVVLFDHPMDRDSVMEAMRQQACHAEGVLFVRIRHDSKWIRDFGPTTLSEGGRVRALDWYYDESRPQDDQFPAELAALTGTRLTRVPLAFEGGNLISNGQGLVVTTTKLFEENYGTPGDPDTAQQFAEAVNAGTLAVLEPLHGEGTRHVDMFAAFVSADTIVVGQYDRREDPVNAGILDRNAEQLSQLHTEQGPLRVVRIPMDRNDDDCWRTYTNCIFANGHLIVPQYRDGSQVRLNRAIRTYQRLLPDWKISTVDATPLISAGGALHCASLNLVGLEGMLQSTPDDSMPGEGQPAITRDVYYQGDRHLRWSPAGSDGLGHYRGTVMRRPGSR